jgi:hypothetical protein
LPGNQTFEDEFGFKQTRWDTNQQTRFHRGLLITLIANSSFDSARQ